MSHKNAKENNDLDDFRKAMKGLYWSDRGRTSIKPLHGRGGQCGGAGIAGDYGD